MKVYGTFLCAFIGFLFSQGEAQTQSFSGVVNQTNIGLLLGNSIAANYGDVANIDAIVGFAYQIGYGSPIRLGDPANLKNDATNNQFYGTNMNGNIDATITISRQDESSGTFKVSTPSGLPIGLETGFGIKHSDTFSGTYAMRLTWEIVLDRVGNYVWMNYTFSIGGQTRTNGAVPIGTLEQFINVVNPLSAPDEPQYYPTIAFTPIDQNFIAAVTLGAPIDYRDWQIMMVAARMGISLNEFMKSGNIHSYIAFINGLAQIAIINGYAADLPAETVNSYYASSVAAGGIGSPGPGVSSEYFSSPEPPPYVPEGIVILWPLRGYWDDAQ